jgi:2-polyprenyl-6-methoxyphenol hydroxylase-like FAD-dependent oxidoreductase
MKDVLIIGASISGLSAALAFQAKGFKVTVIESDSAPNSDITPADAFSWRRRGVAHAMQPHFFLSGLRNYLADLYPGLLNDFIEAGVEQVSLSQCIHSSAAHRYKAKDNDEDLTFFAARRSAFELVMYRYVERQQNIQLLSDVKVKELLFDGDSAPFTVKSCLAVSAGELKRFDADYVIDASGRTTSLLKPICQAGAIVDDFMYKSKSAYYTRHYQLLPGQAAPEFMGMPSAMFDDLVAVTFIADNRNFVISLVVNQDDPLLYGNSMSDTTVFEEIVRRIPKAARWIESSRAEPTSNVIAWANMDFFWRSLISADQPQILSYFPVGDTMVRSNPKFGRGCTWAVMGSHILAESIAEGGDVSEMILRYERHINQYFRSDWEVMLQVDKDDQIRFERAVGLRSRTLLSEVIAKFTGVTSNIAVSVDPELYREVVRGFYGLTSPMAWLKKPSNWFRILRSVFMPSESKRLAIAYSERPSRSEMGIIINNCKARASVGEL